MVSCAEAKLLGEASDPSLQRRRDRGVFRRARLHATHGRREFASGETHARGDARDVAIRSIRCLGNAADSSRIRTRASTEVGCEPSRPRADPETGPVPASTRAAMAEVRRRMAPKATAPKSAASARWPWNAGGGGGCAGTPRDTAAAYRARDASSVSRSRACATLSPPAERRRNTSMPSANVGRISAAPPDARRRTVAEEACGARLERVERVGRRGLRRARAGDGGGSARMSLASPSSSASVRASSARVAARRAWSRRRAPESRQHARPSLTSPEGGHVSPGGRARRTRPADATRGAANAATDARIDDIRGRARAPRSDRAHTRAQRARSLPESLPRALRGARRASKSGARDFAKQDTMPSVNGSNASADEARPTPFSSARLTPSSFETDLIDFTPFSRAPTRNARVPLA